MAAYLIVDVHVSDPEAYAEYRKLVPPTLEKYGGRFVVRGGPHETVEGEWAPGRLVMVAFDDAAAARRWYDSPEYSVAKALRFKAASANVILVEGV